jgi:hypothetical protein
MATKVKYYTVRVSEEAWSSPMEIWYKRKIGQEFKTKLEPVENNNGKIIPAFKCITSPFWHIYPVHCTIVKEEMVEV